MDDLSTVQTWKEPQKKPNVIFLLPVSKIFKIHPYLTVLSSKSYCCIYNTECPKIYCNSILHLLQYRFAVNFGTLSIYLQIMYICTWLVMHCSNFSIQSGSINLAYNIPGIHFYAKNAYFYYITQFTIVNFTNLYLFYYY